MDKETLRMQMLSGIITESEYKAKLEENIHDLTPSHKGSHSTGRPDFNKMTADEIEDYLEKDKDNPGGLYGRSLSIVKHILDKKRKEETEKESLNEHYVAGGIVGIGAINQIPSRVKADYEDAFEYFLSQKYSLNEADEATAVGEKVEAAVEDKLETTVDNLSDEQKDQLRAELVKAGITANSRIEDVAGKLDKSLTEAEGDTKTKVANALSNIGGGLMKSMFVPLIPLIVGYTTGAGFGGGLAITAGVAGALIGLAKLLEAEKSMKEGKEVEESDLYEANPLEGGPGYMTKYRVGVLSALIADAEKDLIKYEEELSPELTEKMKGTFSPELIEKMKGTIERLKSTSYQRRRF
jgi:hypothetical protein